MSKPTSARSKPAGLSRTAAKRQAHRESSMHREPGEGWTVTATYDPWPATYTLGRGLSFSVARRTLAAWRAERVRELMGLPEPLEILRGSGDLASSLSRRAVQPDCGHLVEPKMSLEQLDRYEK